MCMVYMTVFNYWMNLLENLMATRPNALLDAEPHMPSYNCIYMYAKQQLLGRLVEIEQN